MLESDLIVLPFGAVNKSSPAAATSAPIAYVPEGAVEIAAELRESIHPRVGDAVLDILDRIADRPIGLPILRKWAIERYGRFGGRGKQRYVWDVVKDALVAHGLIVEFPGYIVGHRAKKYAMGFGWQDRPQVRVENPVGGRKPPTAKCPIKIPGWLSKHIEGARIDSKGAMKFLLQNAGADAATTEYLADSGDYNEISQVVAAHAGQVAAAYVTNRLVPMWRWQQDNHTWTTRDPSGWRVHTPISNLPSELRPFLRFGNAPEGELAEIDATNSQAVFLAVVAHKELKCAESEEFADICGRGQFYEETYFTAHGRYPSPAERSGWKEKVMETWLYASLGCQMGSPVGRAIGKRFPKIHKWMGDIKAEHGIAHLPCEMQRAEARIWIDALIPRFEVLGIPVFTIHDCVIVPVERMDEAMEEISALYAAEGIAARFNITKLAPDPLPV